MRASSLRYPKAQIAAGLLAGLYLGYACTRPRARPRIPLASPGHDLCAVAQFFKATRRAWNIRVSGL
jgi:hypothetical protein